MPTFGVPQITLEGSRFVRYWNFQVQGIYVLHYRLNGSWENNLAILVSATPAGNIYYHQFFRLGLVFTFTIVKQGCYHTNQCYFYETFIYLCSVFEIISYCLVLNLFTPTYKMNNMIPKIKLYESYFIWLLDPGVAHSSLVLKSVKLIMFIQKPTYL